MSILRHFAGTRGVEVCVLQASPLLGAYLGGLDLEGDGLARLGLLMLGSTALTAHVFVFNDWAGYTSDAHDPRRAGPGSGGHDIGRGQVGWLAIALLVVAGVALAAVGASALLIGAGIAALSLVYSLSPRLGKSTPIAASLNHLVGGALHFLLGYTTAGAVDGTGVVLSAFFGLVFAAGHLMQEVRDCEFDSAHGIRTSAVVFGRRRAFLASFGLFTVAYGLVLGLAVSGVLPDVLLLSPIAWVLHAAFSRQALRRGLGFETAVWMQRRYRLLFAFVGLAMLTPY
ncbi:MAG TPA: UbiA family prenyltransferase [Thermoleophilaceae bacterium]|nr:UbiA family prenyltransferase [Thermoleophilaceae bacterium]